jgi:hypothetical protein
MSKNVFCNFLLPALPPTREYLCACVLAFKLNFVAKLSCLEIFCQMTTNVERTQICKNWSENEGNLGLRWFAWSLKSCSFPRPAIFMSRLNVAVIKNDIQFWPNRSFRIFYGSSRFFEFLLRDTTRHGKCFIAVLSVVDRSWVRIPDWVWVTTI